MNKLYDKPLVSVIIPVYDVEDYVEECIESVISQTYTNLEIIIVNDGSKDSSRFKCSRIAEKDERIKIIDKENGGLSSARNAGLEISNGDFLSFVDSDDYIDNRMLETLVSLIIEKSADIACCNYDEVNEKSEYIFTHKVRFEGVETYERYRALELMLAENYFKCFACNKLFRRTLFDGIRYPEGKHYEDIITLYELLIKSNKLVFTSKVLYHYRVRRNSITHTKFTNKKYDLLIPIRQIFNENKHNNIILFGCCLYYIYFLDDMILGKCWDEDVYNEYCFLYDLIKNPLKVDVICGMHKKIQMLICRKYPYIYKFMYFFLKTLWSRL